MNINDTFAITSTRRWTDENGDSQTMTARYKAIITEITEHYFSYDYTELLSIDNAPEWHNAAATERATGGMMHNDPSRIERTFKRHNVVFDH